MDYIFGVLALIYGYGFYKVISALRQHSVGDFVLEPVEANSLKKSADRLLGELELEFVAQYLEPKPIVDQGYPNHHLVYRQPKGNHLLWFFLCEKEAELRAAVLRLEEDGTVAEIEQGESGWKETWNNLELQAEADLNEDVEASVSSYLQEKSKTLAAAFKSELSNGRRGLSWGQTFRLYFSLLGKKRASISCNSNGKLCVKQRKGQDPPDWDEIGFTFEDQDLMAQLDLRYRETTKILQSRKKKSWWLLPASLVAFLASFSGWFEWQTVLLLAAVIFIHELGHWAAMRAFKYEDTSFLFLPFFGGLAMGRKKSPKLHESVIVFLAGPIPGVLLAVVLALSLPDRSVFMSRFIMMLWVINLLNLLPIVPLDGGRIVAATIFSKTPRLEVAFRLLTGLALIGFYVYLDDLIFLMLGVFVLVRTGVTKRIADTCRYFRLHPEEERSDAAVAGKTYELFKLNPSQHPQQIRIGFLEQVFQRMESSGAGWGVSLGWFVVYVVSLLGTVGVGMTRILG